MKVLLVDDEPLALIGLQRALEREVPGIEVAASYSNPKEVIEGVSLHRPEAVFLDIHMPEIDGLKLARQIQAVVPGVEIVFVTSYDQYAVRAFQLYALDYIVKPVQSQRLKMTVQRVQEKLQLKKLVKMTDAVAPVICSFGQIRFQLPGQEAIVPKWRTSKVQELFAFLLHHRSQMVYRSTLLELLWPDMEETKAASQLYTAMYHIRQTLKACGLGETVSIRIGELEAGYRLELGDARVDTDMWEQQMRELGVINAGAVKRYERALSGYESDYLGSYTYLWAEHERERLRLLWLHHMMMLGGFYSSSGFAERAVEVYRCVQKLCPDEEESYLALMKLYGSLDNPAGVEEQFFLLKERIERELGLPLGDEVTAWYATWKAEVASRR
ncbi:response regulator [Paenibacillus athensensis]|uniref:Histidine kinase n=1 Tax=Paenibacillus athensensis TaxID=1967502 RepID=A0A4Y8PRP1_9BACL|nr:response regulator [Paenibacillus athensensis]MCD1259297.1 response regulator [Paenibacillus athensensis]